MFFYGFIALVIFSIFIFVGNEKSKRFFSKFCFVFSALWLGLSIFEFMIY